MSHNIPEIKDRLERIRTLLSKKPTWQDDVANQAEKAVRELRRKTPRSDGMGSQRGGKHLADGWTLHTIGRGGKDRIPVLLVVYNQLTHKRTGDALPQARLTSKGHRDTREETLLEILEYGSRPHEIRPVDAEYLHFETREGDEVFTKLVHHPGTKPYGMIRVTRAKTKMRMRKMTARWTRRIASEWGRS